MSDCHGQESVAHHRAAPTFRGPKASPCRRHIDPVGSSPRRFRNREEDPPHAPRAFCPRGWGWGRASEANNNLRPTHSLPLVYKSVLTGFVPSQLSCSTSPTETSRADTPEQVKSAESSGDQTPPKEVPAPRPSLDCLEIEPRNSFRAFKYRSNAAGIRENADLKDRRIAGSVRACGIVS